MSHEENLVRLPGARAACSVSSGIGGGVPDVNYMRLAEAPWDEAKWCDTYDGLNAGGEDWWAIEWPYPIRCNVIQFVHGPMFPNGGWWTSLDVEARGTAGAPWRAVRNARIRPSYDFRNARGDRRPYETYTITFDEVEAVAVRLIGTPGGPAGCTTISKIAVYCRDQSATLPSAPCPIPLLFRLLDPGELWDILAAYEMVTGILFNAETAAGHNLCWYLDAARLEQYSQRSRAIISDPDNFRRILGDAEGWTWFGQATAKLHRDVLSLGQCALHVHHGGLVDFAAPIIVGGEVIGILASEDAIFCDAPDLAWHEQNARRLHLDRERYFRALERTPVRSYQALEATTRFLGTIAGLVANLAQQNLVKEHQMHQLQSRIDTLEAERRSAIAKAITFADEHLTGGITVEDLAREVFMSRVHFSTIFKQACGKTPKQFLIERRIERAKTLLRTTQLSVSDIAAQVGYDSSKTFFRVFRAHTGMTPLQYMRSAPRNEAADRLHAPPALG